jgi:hypothetical protein
MGEEERAQCEMENAKETSINPDEMKQYLTSDEMKELTEALDSIENYKLAMKKLKKETDRIQKLLDSSSSLEQLKQIESMLDRQQSLAYDLPPVEGAHESVMRLLKVAEAREEKAEVEAKIKENEAKIREIALEELNPPYEDAKKYLNKEEYQEFQRSIPKAIDSHIEGYKYYEYEYLVDNITERKRKHEEELQARFEAEEYLKQLNSDIASFKTSLSLQRKEPNAHFPKDVSYCNLQVPQDKSQEWREVIREKIEASIPKSLCSNLFFKLRTFYCSLPHAEYSLADNVPCLDVSLELYVVAEIEYQIKQSQVVFGYSIFNMPNVEETGLLGYDYKLFTPDDLNAAGYYFWQRVPCILIQGLLQGNIEPQGTRITKVSESQTSYEINGFDKEISIPNAFSKYLKAIGSWQGLTEKGIISSKVGEVVARAMERQTKELSSLEIPKLNKGTKKARAFQLFNEGKRPGDPKVKSLGIKPETAYRYYQDWKKIQHISQNAT